MSTNIQTFLLKIQEAATILGDAEIDKLIAQVLEQAQNLRLRILVVGQTGVGRCSVVNAVLNQPDLLPTSFIPKLPLRLEVGYGEISQARLISHHEREQAVALSKVGEILTNPDTPHDMYQCVDFKSNASLLHKAVLQIESLQAPYTSREWHELLSRTDYALLILNATALLSERERRFIKETLLPAFGLERVAIILNQIDTVPEEERADVVEHVKVYLGSLANTPFLLEFSAREVQEQQNEEGALAKSEDALLNFVQYDLVNQHSTLRTAALYQAAELCLTELDRAITQHQALQVANQAELLMLKQRFESQQDWLQKRAILAQQKVETFINTLVKSEFLRSIEQNSLVVQKKLLEAIEGDIDVSKAKHHLPGYMEYLWTSFFEQQTTQLRLKIDQELAQIAERVASDLREFLEELASDFSPLLGTFDPTPDNFRVFISPKKGQHQATALLTGLQVGGLVVLSFNIPLGIAAIGVGQLLKGVFRKEDLKNDRRALLEAATQASRELEKLIKEQVEVHFAQMSTTIKGAVADLYQQAFQRLHTLLDEALEREKLPDRPDQQIEQLQQRILPNLREEFQQLVVADKQAFMPFQSWR